MKLRILKTTSRRHDLKGHALPFPRLFGGSATYQSAEAFSGLFERSHLLVFRYIFALHGEPQEEVGDIWLETFFRAWRSRHRFTGSEDAAIGWLLQIARNLVIDGQRKQQRHPVRHLHELEEFVAPEAMPESQLIASEQNAALWKMLDTLTPEQREMIILRYIVGWQVKQIAQHLNLPENTVAVTLKRLLTRLAQSNEDQS
jgi:RNA polymerase sigma-70 factor (ECF subfamily)